MITHMERTGRALAILWRQFREWENTMPWISGNGTMKRWHIASKCKALIKHDRVMRGDI